MRDFQECQAFVEHLRGEHEQIHQAVASVKRDLLRVDPPCEPTTMRDHLSRLRHTLVEHFNEEEQGGCLEEAVSCAPHLSSDVAKIENEHASILKLLDQLIKRSDDCAVQDYRESFRRFATILQAHEASENRILHTAFGTGEFETDDSPSMYGESP